jgi:predicted small secreted protein
MRALVISTLVGAGLVLSGCQTMSGQGNDIGGVSYDKAALGTLIGAAAGYGVSKGNANGSSSKTTVQLQLVRFLVVQVVYISIIKRKNYVSKWQVQVLMLVVIQMVLFN